MTLPYPDSPDVDENIGASISRIEQNLEYLDGQIGTGAVKMIISASCDASRTGVVDVTGVGFTPKALVVHATEDGGNAQSWGMGCKTSTTNSASCACTWFDGGGGGLSSLNCVEFYQTSGSVAFASISLFLSDGVRMNWSKTNTPSGNVLNLLYLFLG